MMKTVAGTGNCPRLSTVFLPSYTKSNGDRMKKDKDLVLKTTTDIKVFLLFLLDRIGGPIDRTTLMEIVEENTDEISLDYGECLRQLTESEHVYFDAIADEEYYMVSEKGRMVASELYDSLDPAFRERSLRSAIRHISVARSAMKVSSSISECDSGKFRVLLSLTDSFGEVMTLSVTVASRSEAEAIREAYEAKPDGVYKGVMFSLTGRFDYIS